MSLSNPSLFKIFQVHDRFVSQLKRVPCFFSFFSFAKDMENFHTHPVVLNDPI